METSLNTKQRESNLELFRIITMFLIVAHHYVVNSGLTTLMWEDPTAKRSIFYFLFSAWGKTGINCFLMITGYFMCQSKITAKKYVKIVGELFFYRVVLYILFCFAGYQTWSMSGFLLYLRCFSSVSTNFFGCFFLFYLFIPFLNLLIKAMKEREHLFLIILLCFMYVYLGTVKKTNVSMNYVSWFCVIYFIGAYIRFYPKKVFQMTKLWAVILIWNLLLAGFSVVAGAYESAANHTKVAYYYVSDCNKVFAVTVAVSAFLFFKNLKIPYNKVINTMGASTFGVLCIHANSDTMRRWLWVDLLKNAEMFSKDGILIILHAFCCGGGGYISCAPYSIPCGSNG